MNFFDQIFGLCDVQVPVSVKTLNQLSNHTLQMILYFLLMLHINAIESPERPPGKFFIFNLPILSNID